MGGAEKERENVYELGFSGVRPVEYYSSSSAGSSAGRFSVGWLWGWHARIWQRPSRLIHIVYSSALCGEEVTLGCELQQQQPRLILTCLSITQGGLASCQGAPRAQQQPPDLVQQGQLAPAFLRTSSCPPSRQWWEAGGAG